MKKEAFVSGSERSAAHIHTPFYCSFNHIELCGSCSFSVAAAAAAVVVVAAQYNNHSCAPDVYANILLKSVI